MGNQGVKCNVRECIHHESDCKCRLDTIEVTHEKTGANAVATPHFCKSYEEK